MYIFLINCKIVICKILSEREINVQFRYFLTDKRASRCILWKQASITGRRIYDRIICLWNPLPLCKGKAILGTYIWKFYSSWVILVFQQTFWDRYYGIWKISCNTIPSIDLYLRMITFYRVILINSAKEESVVFIEFEG